MEAKVKVTKIINEKRAWTPKPEEPGNVVYFRDFEVTDEHDQRFSCYTSKEELSKLVVEGANLLMDIEAQANAKGKHKVTSITPLVEKKAATPPTQKELIPSSYIQTAHKLTSELAIGRVSWLPKIFVLEMLYWIGDQVGIKDEEWVKEFEDEWSKLNNPPTLVQAAENRGAKVVSKQGALK